MTTQVWCSVCDRAFSGQRYWKQHLKYQRLCAIANERGEARALPQSPAKKARHEEDSLFETPSTVNESVDTSFELSPEVRNLMEQYGAESDPVPQNVEQNYNFAHDSEESSDNDVIFAEDASDAPDGSDESEAEQQEEMANNNAKFADDEDESTGDNDDIPVANGVITKADPELDDIAKFKKYCANSKFNNVELPNEHVAGIKLLRLLVIKRAPLNLYDAIFEWHGESLDAHKYVSRQSLIKELNARYELEQMKPYMRQLELPFTKARIKAVHHDAKAQVISMLTDPRIKNEDYLFWNDDPFSAPPDEFDTVDDVNSGYCYRETYKALIEPNPMTDNGRRKVLMPILFYMDGAVTGQFANLPIEQLKLTLGILKASTRDEEWSWRCLGYVKNYLPEATRAADMIKESTHVDSKGYEYDTDTDADEEEEDDEEANREEPKINRKEADIDEVLRKLAADTFADNEEEVESGSDEEDEQAEDEHQVPACNAQDLHHMLGSFLESYRDLEENGLDWDLNYKGKVHKVHFVFYVSVIKGDTVEHDKHCGSYNSRGKGVKQLCRYCTCPNEETDEAYVDHMRKSQEMIEAMINAGDQEGLNNISQQYIRNCWYHIRFGCHRPGIGVHGACLVEILHWFHLGKYKYLRGAFFEQLGKTSKAATKFNDLAKMMGRLLKRQSNRDLPRTSFSKGIKQGKLMAHEMQGVMLVLLTCLRTTAGREYLLNQTVGKSKGNFGTETKIKDWIMLIETMMEWETWLSKTDGHSVYYIKRMRTKVRELMEMEKSIAQRQKGMKYRTFNFHVGKHVADDMLDHGSPKIANSQSDEMRHKTSKTAALQTQKIPDKFDYQVASRLHEQLCLDLGLSELEGHPIWEYFDASADCKEKKAPDHVDDMDEQSADSSSNSDGQADTDSQIEKEIDECCSLFGTHCQFVYDRANHWGTMKMDTRMKHWKKFNYPPDLQENLVELIEGLPHPYRNRPLQLYTDHKRHDQIFRASPHRDGYSWYDWAIVDWGEEGGELPVHLRCFVDLRDLVFNSQEEEDQSDIWPGIWAICEAANPSKNKKEQAMSDLFVPFTKEMGQGNYAGGPQHGERKRKYYRLDCNALVAPTVMIPDIGNKNNAAYLQLLPKESWASLFEEWLDEEHTRRFAADTEQ